MIRQVLSALLVEPARMIAGLWARRELIGEFTRRNIEMRHRGSRLGAFWALINPLSMLALYFVVFGLIYGQRFKVLPDETAYDFALALFLGLALFHAFSETLAWAPGVITSNPNFVKKVVFPLEALPVANMGATTFHLCVSLGLIVLAGTFSSAGPSLHVLWLPAIVLPLLLMAQGMAWFLAALGVFVRDVGQLTAFASTALLFASAVMYPPTQIPANLQFLLHNPLLQLVDLARHTVLWHQPMPWSQLASLYLWGGLIFAFGAIFFSLLRKSFAEVI